MLAAMIARFLAVVLIGLAAIAQPARAQNDVRAQAVVELYTSQGCVQCTRANRLLGMFARDESVLALTFPVGIWDYLGWRDTFARPEYAERQRAYSQALRVRGRFTPQLVFNGARQISASSWDDARAALNAEREAGWPVGAPELSITRPRGDRVRVTVGAGPRGTNADVWLVSFDPGPITVLIHGGLNINRTITYYNLVSSIEHLGVWDGTPVWFERGRCDPECALLVQAPNGGRVLASAYTAHHRRY
jgi:hypothetical protein